MNKINLRGKTFFVSLTLSQGWRLLLDCIKNNTKPKSRAESNRMLSINRPFILEFNPFFGFSWLLATALLNTWLGGLQRSTLAIKIGNRLSLSASLTPDTLPRRLLWFSLSLQSKVLS